MGEVRTPFELPEPLTKPPLPSNPRISDDIQQTLATLVAYDGIKRRLLRSTPTGMLQTVNPLAKQFANILANTANYLWQGDDIKCSEVVVRANPDNSQRVWVNIYAAAAADTGWPLDGGEHIVLTLTNLSHLHLKILDNGEKVILYYTQ